MPLTSEDVPGQIPTPKDPPDSQQSGQQNDPDGTSDSGDTDESKKLPADK